MSSSPKTFIPETKWLLALKQDLKQRLSSTLSSTELEMPKIGNIVGGSARDGADLKRRFLRNTPALESLRERVTRASQRGYLTGLDGRRLRVRSELEYPEAAGAIVMKKALLQDDYAKQWKLQIRNIHEAGGCRPSREVMACSWCLKAAGVEFDYATENTKSVQHGLD